jgi:ribosomal protein S18 acetylase RimI-like enzyme
VSAQGTRSGELESLAAVHEANGTLAIAAVPGASAPFLGTPDRVRRIVGAREVVESLLDQSPVLRLRRGAGVEREVFVFDGDPPRRPPGVERAKLESWEALELLRSTSVNDVETLTPSDMASTIQRGHVWVLNHGGTPVGLFRIEGIGQRRIQVTDLCVHPKFRGQGLGTALLEAAASIAKGEFSRGCVVAEVAHESGERAARRAGFASIGMLEDVQFD